MKGRYWALVAFMIGATYVMIQGQEGGKLTDRQSTLTAERDPLQRLAQAAIGTPFDKLDATNRIGWIVIDPETTFVDHQIYDESISRWIWEIVLTKPGLTKHIKCTLPGSYSAPEQVILLDSQGNTVHQFQW